MPPAPDTLAAINAFQSGGRPDSCTTAAATMSQTTHAAPARPDGMNSIRLKDAAAECAVLRIVRDISRYQIPRDLRVGQLEKLLERQSFIRGCIGMPLFQIPDEQQVQLFHAAAAAPLQLAKLRVRGAAVQCWRSTIIFLISAMALAGLRSFGHASVQFMMV